MLLPCLPRKRRHSHTTPPPKARHAIIDGQRWLSSGYLFMLFVAAQRRFAPFAPRQHVVEPHIDTPIFMPPPPLRGRHRKRQMSFHWRLFFECAVQMIDHEDYACLMRDHAINIDLPHQLQRCRFSLREKAVPLPQIICGCCLYDVPADRAARRMSPPG